MIIRLKHILFVCLLAITAADISAQCAKKYNSVLHKTIYTMVDLMPEFSGGTDGWRRYLERNLVVPDIDSLGLDDCMGQWSLKSSFIVNIDGSISHIIINNKTDTSTYCQLEKSFYRY